ncbi:ATP-binding protein [Streptomyces mexicanus]|jgi:hypothetical protein|uniref:ATP-binding protein n=1 Tax=Streptomyces mexicanus TaxID=178566 RepID=A0A7X1HWL5_9ACTN|nr:ATP-binding protein [Streptomyces mexicanus]MBC2864261.1 ATP-binding protein [Streptomyces mexicanus]
MKQSAAKTLGVAALGAAFAAAGAGAANAAPALPDAGKTLGTVGAVGQVLPAQNVAKALPGAAPALAQATPTVETGLGAVQAAKPVGGLLGGLPVQSLPTQGLSLDGLPVSGLPVR